MAATQAAWSRTALPRTLPARFQLTLNQDIPVAHPDKALLDHWHRSAGERTSDRLAPRHEIGDVVALSEE